MKDNAAKTGWDNEADPGCQSHPDHRRYLQAPTSRRMRPTGLDYFRHKISGRKCWQQARQDGPDGSEQGRDSGDSKQTDALNKSVLEGTWLMGPTFCGLAYFNQVADVEPQAVSRLSPNKLKCCKKLLEFVVNPLCENTSLYEGQSHSLCLRPVWF